MKSLFIAITVIALSTGLVCPGGLYAFDTNIIKNGSFEKGLHCPDNWDFDVWEPEYFEYGNIGLEETKGVAIQPKFNGLSFFQKIELETSKEYFLSMMYKFSDFAPYVNVKIIYPNEEDENVVLSPKNLLWTSFQTTFVAKESTAEIFISATKIDQRIWFDNIIISEKPIILKNGSFENIKNDTIGSNCENLQDWDYNLLSGTVNTDISNDVYSGSNALIMDASSSSGTASIEQTVRDIIPGSSYVLTGLTKGNCSSLNVSIEFLDAYGNNISGTPTVSFTVSSSANWSEFSQNFSIPAEAALIKVKLTCSLTNSTFNIDDISLEKIN